MKAQTVIQNHYAFSLSSKLWQMLLCCLCWLSEFNSFNLCLGEPFNFHSFKNMKMQLWLVRTKNMPFHYLHVIDSGENAMVTLKSLPIHVTNRLFCYYCWKIVTKYSEMENRQIHARALIKRAANSKNKQIEAQHVFYSCGCIIDQTTSSPANDLMMHMHCHNSFIEIVLLKKHFSKICFT